MRFLRRKIAIIVVLAYVIFSLYAAYNVFFNKRVISRVHRVVKKGTVIIGKTMNHNHKHKQQICLIMYVSRY